MTWPPITPGQQHARRWSILTFLLGVLSVTLFFVLQEPTPTGWRTPLLLISVPFVLGFTGIVFGAISKRYLWVVLNAVVMLSFPLLMFFGTLILGP